MSIFQHVFLFCVGIYVMCVCRHACEHALESMHAYTCMHRKPCACDVCASHVEEGIMHNMLHILAKRLLVDVLSSTDYFWYSNISTVQVHNLFMYFCSFYCIVSFHVGVCISFHVGV